MKMSFYSEFFKTGNKISQNDVFYTNQNFQSQSINVYKYFQANNKNNNNNNNFFFLINFLLITIIKSIKK